MVVITGVLLPPALTAGFLFAETASHSCSSFLTL